MTLDGAIPLLFSVITCGWTCVNLLAWYWGFCVSKSHHTVPGWLEYPVLLLCCFFLYTITSTSDEPSGGNHFVFWRLTAMLLTRIQVRNQCHASWWRGSNQVRNATPRGKEFIWWPGSRITRGLVAGRRGPHSKIHVITSLGSLAIHLFGSSHVSECFPPRVIIQVSNHCDAFITSLAAERER